jgi:hypothetical protein
MGALHQDRELELITELCRRLAELGLNVGMTDARPTVVIRTRDESPLLITVDPSGQFFKWSEPERQHPVTDPSGAAALISDHVKAQRAGPGEAS